MTKLCPHILGWTNWPELKNFIQRTQPRVIKLVGPTACDTYKINELKKISPSSLWLYRHYVDNQPLDNPKQNAKDFANKVWPHITGMDIIEGYNEIDPRDHSKDPPRPLDIEIIKRYNEFDARLADIVNLEWGKEYCALNWSNGQPPDEAWEYLRDALNRADYIGLHNYGWETLPVCPQFALRHRKIFDLLPIKRPMILSEVGITNAVFGGPDLGWKSWEMPPALFGKEGRVATVWAWFLDRINEDPYVVGANAYTTGRLKGDNWGTHDFTPRLYKLVGDYILGHPSPDPYLPNGGNNMGVWDNVPSQIKQWKELIGHLTRKYPVPIPPYQSTHVSPAKVVACIIRIESNGDPNAVGGDGKAHGLMQVWKPHYPGKDLLDPGNNIRVGLAILKGKLGLPQVAGNLREALYCYSGGTAWANKELYEEKYWLPFVKHYKTFWGVNLEAQAPTPDWEAKYKKLKIKIKIEADILDDVIGTMDAATARVQQTRDELDKIIE